MTNEEAIEVLDNTKVMILKGSGTDLAKASYMAVEALKKQIDIDRIVEQLEAEKYRGMEGLEPLRVAFNFGINKAIEIVKAGGKDE